MDRAPEKHFNPNRTIRVLTLAWVLAAAAWTGTLLLVPESRPYLAVVIALFAAGSFGLLVVLAASRRTREVWAVLASDNTPEAFLMWTVLGSLAACFLAIVGWVLITVGFFAWVPDWLLISVFASPIVAVAVRLKDFKRFVWIPHRTRRAERRAR